MQQRVASILSMAFLAIGTAAVAQAAVPVLTERIDESQLVLLEGNTPPAALQAANDRGSFLATGLGSVDARNLFHAWPQPWWNESGPP